MIDFNKDDSTSIWKTLKEIIEVNQQEIEDIEFKILGNIEECNIADKFNVYYIQSINNIAESINKDAKSRDAYKEVIYVIENKEIMENFEMIRGFRESCEITKERKARKRE